MATRDFPYICPSLRAAGPKAWAYIYIIRSYNMGTSDFSEIYA